METIDELKAAVKACTGDTWSIRRQKREFLDDNEVRRVKPLLHVAHLEHVKVTEEANALFDKRIGSAEERERDAQYALNSALVAAASADTGWHPVGTKVVEWETRRFAYDGRLFKSGQTGVVEVFKIGDKYVGGEYRKPHAGDVVIRLLKKDGKPGSKLGRIGDWNRDNWQPEGVTPAKAAK